MAVEANGAVNPELRVWVGQMERRQLAAEAAAACKTRDRCLSGWQRVGGALELASVFAPLPTPAKATLAVKITAAGAKSTKAGRVVAPANRATGTTVIGRHPDYVELSERLGARRFDVPKSVWDSWTPEQQWAANRRFLDRTITRGDEIVLATPVRQAGRSFYRRELGYLFSKGYRMADDGRHLVAPQAR
jgi:hypothetical protein